MKPAFTDHELEHLDRIAERRVADDAYHDKQRQSVESYNAAQEALQAHHAVQTGPQRPNPVQVLNSFQAQPPVAEWPPINGKSLVVFGAVVVIAAAVSAFYPMGFAA